MPVTTCHKQHSYYTPQWRMIRDAYAGPWVVKLAGERYLPRLQGMENVDYDEFLCDAEFYNVTGRTVQGLVGTAFRIPPVVTAPDAVMDWLPDITLSGIPFESFLRKEVEEKLLTGRYGILVDRDTAANSRPKFAGYTAESITLWVNRVVNGMKVPALVVLRESVDEPEDEFTYKEAEQYRVLDLDPTGSYRVRLFRQLGDRKDWVIVNTVEPRRFNQRLNFIPFVADGVADLTLDCEKPPVLDLVMLNFLHYRLTALHARALAYTSAPQGWLATSLQSPGKMRIGSPYAWILAPGDTTGYLEFTGAGIGSIEKELNNKERRMVQMGASVLEEDKAGVESAETARIRKAEKTSLLHSIVGMTELATTKALRWASWWAGATNTVDDVNVQVVMNDEFITPQLMSQDLVNFFSVQKEGGMSRETYLYNVQRAGLFPDGHTVEDEQAAIVAESEQRKREAEEAMQRQQQSEDEEDEEEAA